jgi:hypothetical protein
LLGRSDLHLLRLRGGLLYAYDLARNRFVTTTDFGRTWTESRPPGLMLDLAFDPGRPQRLVASSSEGLVRSEDAGRSWQPLAREIGLRLAWPRPNALYLIDERGVVHRSRDGGADREIVSTLGTLRRRSPRPVTARCTRPARTTPCGSRGTKVAPGRWSSGSASPEPAGRLEQSRA